MLVANHALAGDVNVRHVIHENIGRKPKYKEKKMQESHSKLLLTGLIGVIVLLIVGAFYYVYITKGGAAQLEIDLGNGKAVKIDLKESNKASIDIVLQTLFKDQKSTRMAKTLLKEYYDLYELDSKLVNVIRDEDPNTDFSKKLRKLLSNSEGPFDRNSHNYYDINSFVIIDALKANGKDHHVSKELRLMARDNEPPIFSYETIPVNVSFTEDSKILKGFAAVCNVSKYIGRNIVLRNPSNGAMIQVFARNTFTCGSSGHRIQLTTHDASNLFDDRVRGSSKIAEMTVAQPGMKFDISQISS